MKRVRGRSDPALRCPACRLHHALCICDRLPSIPTRTRVVLVLHQLEARKPTNTGRLALRCLPNGLVVVRGRPTADGLPAAAGAGGGPPPWLAEAPNPVLLFPDEDARPLAEWRPGAGPPVTLVVPDGTWRQASNTRRRIPGLDRAPAAALAPGASSRYRLRRARREGCVSTLEAIARALAILEGDPSIEQRLLAVLELQVERTLRMGGRTGPAADGGAAAP
jgi:DTW domain-containing protein YfiP